LIGKILSSYDIPLQDDREILRTSFFPTNLTKQQNHPLSRNILSSASTAPEASAADKTLF